MATRNGSAEWRGDLRSGEGNLTVGDGVFQGNYSFASRFEEGEGTNPEELVAAVLDKLAGHGFGDVEEVEAVEEHMTFALPRELRAARPAGPGSSRPG